MSHKLTDKLGVDHKSLCTFCVINDSRFSVQCVNGTQTILKACSNINTMRSLHTKHVRLEHFVKDTHTHTKCINTELNGYGQRTTRVACQLPPQWLTGAQTRSEKWVLATSGGGFTGKWCDCYGVVVCIWHDLNKYWTWAVCTRAQQVCSVLCLVWFHRFVTQLDRWIDLYVCPITNSTSTSISLSLHFSVHIASSASHLNECDFNTSRVVARVQSVEICVHKKLSLSWCTRARATRSE